jgi:SpoVK/Ycf46/Vps4 family AAA+-type ATPase
MAEGNGNMFASAIGLANPGPTDSGEPVPFRDGTEHLLAELTWLRLMLHREILRLRAAGLFTEDPFRGLYVSDEQVDSLLRDRYAHLAGRERGLEAPPQLQILNEEIREMRASIQARLQASLAAGVSPPLARLADLFQLSEFEWQALVVCAASEIDLRFETLYSYAQNDVNRKHPSAGLILRLLCGDVYEQSRCRIVFSHEGRLLRQGLVRFTEPSPDRERPFLARPLKIEERIISFLLEMPSLDDRLHPFTVLSKPARALSSLHFPESLSRSQGDLVRSTPNGGTGATFLLYGPGGVGKRSAAEALCAGSDRRLLSVDLSAALTSSLPLDTLLALLRREAVLCGADLFFAHAELLAGDDHQRQQWRMTFERAFVSESFRVFVGSELPWPDAGCRGTEPRLSFDFPTPSFPDRLLVWHEALAQTGRRLDSAADIAVLANKFVLTAGQIHRACREASSRALLGAAADASITMENLEAAARSQSNHGLRRLAQKISAHHDWSALVLPPHAMRQLRDVCSAEKYRQVVYSQWGFDQRLIMGKGLNTLFCGSSGTGKTMAAGILARELGLDLYKIDLSTVVSKYIGETEKQLSQIFREAGSSNAILFFDEADALFGKRSEVKDAHDRYANVEVAYLLQKMEEYEGVVILATNFRKNMDDAFTRRMHHIVEFPFPDAEYRERIWKSIIPPTAPLAGDVDFGFLARQFELAGGNIRNVAVAAAFLAAEEDCPMRMEHFIVATARELQKVGKLPSRSEFRDYYELIRARA